jgi:hypothetical protein
MATFHWLTGKSGVFGLAANWDVGTVPGSGDDAIIDATGTYTVTSSASATVLDISTINTATLAITGSTFTLTDGTDGGINAGTITVGNASILNIGTDATASEFNNAGKLLLSGTVKPTLLQIFGDVSLTGGGAVTLSDNSNNYIDATSTGATSTVTIGGTATKRRRCECQCDLPDRLGRQ